MIEDLTEEELSDLIYRLRHKPTHITALEKMALADYVEAKEKDKAVSSCDQHKE